MAKPAISLCMIAKNEENNLDNCLSSVKDAAEEIIIIDTGSTDKTKEIGKKFNAKIIDFKWADDFSAARNESLKHVTKDWILVIDADESLDEEGVNIIKHLVEDKETDAFIFLQKNYTNNASIAGFVSEEHKKDGKTYAGWYGSLIVRLFRNKRSYKFEGTVHELVEPSIESKKGKISAADVVVHNYGNTEPDMVKKKRKYYLELCKKKSSQTPTDSSYYELGVLYKENDDLENAVKSLKKAIKLNPKRHAAWYELGVICEQKKDYDGAVKNYTESLRLKESSEAFQNLGVCYLKRGMLKEAYRNLVKAMLLNPNRYTTYNNLGAVLEKIGNYDSAVQMLDIGIKLNPKNTIGFYNLGIAFDKKGNFEKAMEAYEKAVELGHTKSEDIKKRIKQIKTIIINTHNYKYGFKCGVE